MIGIKQIWKKTPDVIKKVRATLIYTIACSLPFTAAQAVNTAISQPGGYVSMFPDDAPVYVNPGEFVALCVKGIGTVGTSGTIASYIQFMYTWE